MRTRSDLPTWIQVRNRIEQNLDDGGLVPTTVPGKYRTVLRMTEKSVFIKTTTGSASKAVPVPIVMVRWMWGELVAGREVDSAMLKVAFPTKGRRGHGIFSMAGGILEALNLARQEKKGRRYYYKLAQ